MFTVLTPVKLNNPHKGTETCFFNSSFSLSFLVAVKLNNPHKGTETYFSSRPFLANNSISVKLNNPHKGTETARCKYSGPQHNHYTLN